MNNVTQKAAQTGMTGLIFQRITGISLETATILWICRELDGKIEERDDD